MPFYFVLHVYPCFWLVRELRKAFVVDFLFFYLDRLFSTPPASQLLFCLLFWPGPLLKTFVASLNK